MKRFRERRAQGLEGFGGPVVAGKAARELLENRPERFEGARKVLDGERREAVGDRGRVGGLGLFRGGHAAIVARNAHKAEGEVRRAANEIPR